MQLVRKRPQFGLLDPQTVILVQGVYLEGEENTTGIEMGRQMQTVESVLLSKSPNGLLKLNPAGEALEACRTRASETSYPRHERVCTCAHWSVVEGSFWNVNSAGRWVSIDRGRPEAKKCSVGNQKSHTKAV